MAAPVIEFPGADLESAIDVVCAARGVTREEFLTFAVAYLSRTSALARADVVAALPLTKFERRVFDCLNRHFGTYVHVGELIDAVYWDDPNGGPANPSATLGNFTSRLRRKLAPVGLVIQWHPGGAGRCLDWAKPR